VQVLFDPKLSKAIRENDALAVESFMLKNPEYKEAYSPFGGGTWLHYAAGAGSADILRRLISLGMDVNQGAARDGRLPLKDAAYEGNSENVRFLLAQGSRLDTSTSGRNPLFGAIIGGSAEVVGTLLEHGIDASVRYNSETMTDMHATAFALWRGQTELARIIALHMAGGDEVRANALLSEAREVVSRNAPLEARRIVPGMEDLQRE
jgi:uncharacterized protein